KSGDRSLGALVPLRRATRRGTRMTTPVKRRIVWAAVLLGLLGMTPAAAVAKTYYVDTNTGNDLVYTSTMAQNPLTPWKTIKRALSTAAGGDTIIVQPGTYNETVSSKKDGSSGAVITLHSATPGAAIIQPPTGGMGFYILHNYHVIDGFTVTQATVGVRAGPHLS